MSRITNKNIKMGDNYVLPITQSTLTKYEARVESILNDVEEEKKQLLAAAEQEAENIKARAQLSIQDAQQKADEIINNANNEAGNIIEEANKEKEKVQSETEQISKQAYDEGFTKGHEDGLAKFREDSIESINSLDTLASSSFEMKQNIIKSADLDIVELVIAIAQKVTARSFDENMLRELTSSAISQLKNKEQITITVNPQLIESITKISEEFKQRLGQIQNIKIVEDSSLSCDGTIVETPLSRVDARVSSQIDEIAARLINGIRDDVQQE